MQTFRIGDITGFAIERRAYQPTSFRYMKVPSAHLTDNVFIDLGRPIGQPKIVSETYITSEDDESSLIPMFSQTQAQLADMVGNAGWIFDDGSSALMPIFQSDLQGFHIILLHIILPSQIVHWAHVPFHIRAELVARSRGHQLRLGTTSTPEDVIRYTIDCACGFHQIASTEYQLHGIAKLEAEARVVQRSHFADCLNHTI